MLDTDKLMMEMMSAATKIQKVHRGVLARDWLDNHPHYGPLRRDITRKLALEAERRERRRLKGLATEEQELTQAATLIQRRIRKALASRKVGGLALAQQAFLEMQERQQEALEAAED